MNEKKLPETFAGRWIRAVAGNLRKLVLFCFLVAVVTAVFALTRKQQWTAYSVVSVPGGNQSPAMGLGALGDIAGNLLGGGVSSLPGMMNMNGGETQDLDMVFQVLTSRAVSERVIFKYGMLAEFNAPSMDVALNKFSERASVVLTPEGFFVISMKADSREKSAAIVNDMIEFANRELFTIVTSRARRSRLEAEKLLEAAGESLEIAQGNMEKFREKTGLLFPEEQGISTVQLMADLETELILAESRLAGVSGTISSSSPAYVEVARTVRYLRKAMEDKTYGADSLGGFFPNLDTMPALLREYENLVLDLETRRALYLLLRQELESLRLEEARESPTLEVVVPAVPAALRSYPKRAKMVLSYTAVALLLALLWIAVVTYARGLLENEDTGSFWKEIISTATRQLYRGKPGPGNRSGIAG